jgi:hypothetical protein
MLKTNTGLEIKSKDGLNAFRALILLNIYSYYGAGVQVCYRQPSVRSDIRLTMYQLATTTGLSNRMACCWRPVPMLSIYYIRHSDNN